MQKTTSTNTNINYILNNKNESKPIIYDELTDKEFNKLMDDAAKSYADNKGITIDEFKKQLKNDIGL